MAPRSRSAGSATASLVGAGLVLYRQLPKIRQVAGLPAGGSGARLGRSRAPRAARRDGRRTCGARAPSVSGWDPRSSPAPGRPTRSSAAIADDDARRLGDVPPDSRSDAGGAVASRRCATAGWRSQVAEEGFSAGQPQYVFQIPLAGRDEADGAGRHEPALAAQHQEGRQVRGRGERSASADDLPAFHALYVETAERDHFTPRPLAYFQQMFTAMTAEDPDRIRLYLAHHEGDLVAATTWVRVGDARLVLVRRVVDRQARRARVECRAVADDPRRAGRRGPRSTTSAASPTPWPRTTRTSG